MVGRARKRLRLVTRSALKRLAVAALVLLIAGIVAHAIMIGMPGRSHRGPLPPLTDSQAALAAELRDDVSTLAGGIGPRNVFRAERLAVAAAHLAAQLRDAGYAVEEQAYDVFGVRCANLIVEVPGTTAAGEIVIVGAHYDTVEGSPGANDNTSGVAATLALARRLAGATPARTLRFVLFVNEEPPFFQTMDMGSRRYANRCRERGENVVAMLSLETIGCYSDAPGSQRYPFPIGLVYPSTGNFIGFVGNVKSRRLVRRCVGLFRAAAAFPSEGGALPGGIPGVGWSDHWSFWRAGYPAVMVTDTALFRDEHYHGPDDTPEHLDYERMARVVEGLEAVVEALAGPDGS